MHLNDYVWFKSKVYRPPVGTGWGHHKYFLPDPWDITIHAPTEVVPTLGTSSNYNKLVCPTLGTSPNSKQLIAPPWGLPQSQ